MIYNLYYHAYSIAVYNSSVNNRKGIFYESYVQSINKI